MTPKIYSVRVSLTDECPDSIEEIMHGDGSSLGPTQDKIQEVAKKYQGLFEDWEPTCCDYSFPSEEAAIKFAKSVSDKFKNYVLVELISGKTVTQNNAKMRIFDKLPSDLRSRIASLTPVKMESLDVEVIILDNDDCLLIPEEEKYKDLYRKTHINMKCKITGKVRSRMIPLRCSLIMSKMARNKFHLFEEGSDELKKATEAGWTSSDIAYESMISGILRPALAKGEIGGIPCPEILFACTKITIVIYDYNGQQFVGWYFYNENLDKPLNFTSYSV